MRCQKSWGSFIMRKTVFPGLLMLFALIGCETLGTGELGSFNMISTQEEIALGQKVSAQVEKDEKILPDADIQAYLQNIGARLARVSPRQDVQYAFKAIDNIETINAFALPGGNMYVYSGLMKMCSSEAELASVMAHEIAHVALQHHGKSMTRQYGYQLLAGIALGEQPAAAAQIAAGLVGEAVTSRFSREEETQADTLGMEILFRAGYSPNAMISFFDKMAAEQQKNGGSNWLPIFASHPPTTERLQNLQFCIAKYPADMAAKSTVNAERYQEKVLEKFK
jgi:predicted Zn-dependent protease